MEKVAITKIRGNIKETVEDVVTEEIPFTLVVGGQELVTLLCSPSDLEDLVRGFLFTSGLIRKIDEVKKIVLNNEQWTAYIEIVDSAVDIMHRSKIVSDLKIKSSYVNALMTDFQKKSQEYLETGGVHSAALADEKEILVFREDIGRHNAIDKVIGHTILKNNSFQKKILITSGRISSEVLFKVRKCSIPIVISKSAPTNQALKHAREMDITLLGFARGKRMNIYSGEKRITIPS